jgi:hypothetical protein
MKSTSSGKVKSIFFIKTNPQQAFWKDTSIKKLPFFFAEAFLNDLILGFGNLQG